VTEVCYSLLDGAENRQLLDAMRVAIAEATQIEIAVSFVKRSGLGLIFDELEAALQSGRCRKLSFLTSDYLSITDPEALRQLMLLKSQGADVRIHDSSDNQSFHLKTYIFLEADEDNWVKADAFVGSSNLSKSALTDGLEWNYHLRWPDLYDSAAAERIINMRERFSERFEDARALPLTYDWIDAYRERRKVIPIKYCQPAPEELTPAVPEPREHQQHALAALQAARDAGKRRGLVVLATGLGKTWLAAFDAKQAGARRVLFVAHREEILNQAERSFLTILPDARAGRYTGNSKDEEADLVFASVQTLGRESHLSRFAPDSFDYIIVDEFHHAAAAGYQRLLSWFKPGFMLGLTATPDRTDNRDVLALCDNNLIYRMDLFDGIETGHLVPFHYFGIYDESVDYAHIPWRSGRFDPEALTAQLATRQRARHALKEWQDKGLQRTLAFCASRQHADFMKAYFVKAGVKAASVYAGSELGREDALAQLADGRLDVLFAVDLFNEGMDMPLIDTVMMLRPTESSSLFLQQLGRGLRTAEGKPHLVVLDFVANHQCFINRPLLLSGLTGGHRNQQLQRVCSGEMELPDGCFVNYDLAFIDFLQQASSQPLEHSYRRLKTELDRRPELVEFWRAHPKDAGRVRTLYGCWWGFLEQLEELSAEEQEVYDQFRDWFLDLTVSQLSRCFKLVLLRTWLGFGMKAMPVAELSQQARQWLLQHEDWQQDLSDKMKPLTDVPAGRWRTYWSGNPVKAWCRPEKRSGTAWFALDEGELSFASEIPSELHAQLLSMTETLLEWRLAQYQQSRLVPQSADEKLVVEGTSLPFFTSLRIACGHFRSSETGAVEMVSIRDGFGRLNPESHFVARAMGNSMNGGKSPVQDGDYLLLESVGADKAGSISNQVLAVERLDETGDQQFVLRRVVKLAPGDYLLRADNPDYEDMPATDEMLTFARLKAVLKPEDILSDA